MEVAGKPLLVHALERAELIADDALIVTNQDHYFLTENLLKQTPNTPKVSYLLEPKGAIRRPLLRWPFVIFKRYMVMRPCALSLRQII